jgi:hypothetical protein
MLELQVSATMLANVRITQIFFVNFLVSLPFFGDKNFNQTDRHHYLHMHFIACFKVQKKKRPGGVAKQ